MKIFVDTNILVRANVAQYPLHREASAFLKQHQALAEQTWVSRQVIREYIVQLTRGQGPVRPLSISEVMWHLSSIERGFRIADDDAAVTRQLVALLQEFPTGGKQVHDANIVATMLVHQIDTLLTINVDDMRRFATKIKIVPLTPEESQP